jgi:peptide/nickel transport system permease protein
MRYLYRRIAFYLVALWASVTLNFLLPRLMPGSPIDYFIAKYRDQLRNNPHLLDSIRTMLGGTNEPLPVQYIHYLGNLAQANFGVSYSQFPARVSDILGSTLPWTLFLAGASTVLACVLGTLLGIVASWRRGGVVDTVLTPITMFTQSFPSFFVAMLLLYVLGFSLGWFPLQHAYGDNVHPGLNAPFFADVVWHAALPIIAIMVYSIGGWLLGMRNVMINTLAEDFIAMAQAKGLSDRRVMLVYAARNALLPQVTSFAITIGYVVTGLVLIEYVFSYPGVGYTLVNAVQSEDYPLMQALFLLISVAVLGSNMIADLLYARLDPRVRRT